MVINYGDESTTCLVNECDHIKISAFVSGLDCEKVMEKVYKVDEFLQTKLQFAANIDFGYLTSYIKDCGTGLKFTVRILSYFLYKGLRNRLKVHRTHFYSINRAFRPV